MLFLALACLVSPLSFGGGVISDGRGNFRTLHIDEHSVSCSLKPPVEKTPLRNSDKRELSRVGGVVVVTGLFLWSGSSLKLIP